MDNVTAATSNIPDVLATALEFSWIDYFFFFLLLVISVAIGIYFGCVGEKEDTADEYLFGGRVMSIFPIAMSLVASHVSGTTLLGLPAEVYRFGSQYMACAISAVFCCIIIVYIYLPVFYKLQIMSSYEYLKMRFDGRVRSVASFLYVLATLLHTPVVIYIPALALNQVTGISIHKVTPIICAVCIFYTSIGGLKAVVWSDTIQYMVTLASTFVVLIIGIMATGGVANVWKTADEGGRIELFNMDPDVTSRNTFWGVTIGIMFMWVSGLGVNPSSIQRFLAVPNIHAARKSVFIFLFGVVITKAFCAFSGFTMYTKYKDCDPLTAGYVKRSDQLLPYYVLDVARNVPGLPGLFVSGVFSAALSTMSASINTLAGTIFEDFIIPSWGPISDKRSSYILKALVVIIGFACVALVFIVEHLGGVVELSITLNGITHGPLLGMFTLGMLFRSANTRGALVGGVGSLLFMAWMVFGAQYQIMQHKIQHQTKHLSIDGCTDLMNMTTPLYSSTTSSPSVDSESELPFFLYRISFYWFSVIGTMLTLVIGLPVSWLWKNEKDELPHPDLISPAAKWFWSKKTNTNEEYKTVNVHEENLEMVGDKIECSEK